MSIKFIHAADLHIDSPFRGLEAQSERIAAKLRRATRDAFETLVDQAIDEGVAFVVVAGDVFDGDWDNTETGLWTSNQFKRLTDASIPVFVVYGNHDKKSRLIANLGFPKSVKVFSSTAAERAIYPDDFPELAERGIVERVAITGRSYAASECSEDLAASYPDAEPNAFNIGVLHTALGSEGADNYAPTTVTTLQSKGYDYWALGHVHQRRTIATSPCWIGYSGVLQGRHANEVDPKGYYLVEVEEGRLVGEPEFRSVDVFRWARVKVDVSGAETEEELKSLFRETMEDVVSRAENRNVAARVAFSGRTPLYGLLHKKREENDFNAFFLDVLSEFADCLWIQEYELKELSPPIPESAWNQGVLGDVKRDVDGVIRALVKESQEGLELGSEAGKDNVQPILDLGVRLGGDALRFLRDSSDESAFDPLSSRQVAQWCERALEILANGLVK